MTREQIIGAIHAVLRDTMAHPHADEFTPQARLNEDLYLDSVLVMNLLLNLELEHGLAVPEAAITHRPPATVDDLADLFDPEVEALRSKVTFLEAAGSVHDDEAVDIKVHCFVSCLGEALKRPRPLDERPFYFTVWDSQFAVDGDMRLRYHDESVNHDVFPDAFKRLYGIHVRPWYDRSATKADNIALMLDLLDNKKDNEILMVMVDMFHLPERENKFNQNPFPHYLIVEKSDDPSCFSVRDVDYRWEGDIARARVLSAIDKPAAEGGFVFDAEEGSPPDPADVQACFNAHFLPDENPLPGALRTIVKAHVAGENGLTPDRLESAFRELPILTMRKYAYEHGFAYFWRALALPDADFQHWCDEIEVLVSGVKMLHVDVLRLAKTQDLALAPAILDRIDLLDRQERRIKNCLSDVHTQWAHENDMDTNAALSGAA